MASLLYLTKQEYFLIHSVIILYLAWCSRLPNNVINQIQVWNIDKQDFEIVILILHFHNWQDHPALNSAIYTLPMEIYVVLKTFQRGWRV